MVSGRIVIKKLPFVLAATFAATFLAKADLASDALLSAA